MPLLSFTRRWSNDQIANLIRESTKGNNVNDDANINDDANGSKTSKKKKKTSITGLAFYEINFDQQILSALKGFFRSLVAVDSDSVSDADYVFANDVVDDAQNEHYHDRNRNRQPRVHNADDDDDDDDADADVVVLSEFCLYSCPGNESLEEALQVAIELDVIKRYHIKGVIDLDSGQRRVRRWMSIPPSERQFTQESSYVQPSLRPFANIDSSSSSSSSNNSSRIIQDIASNESGSMSNKSKGNKNLLGFSLSCFKVSCDDVKLLRNGILSSTFRGDGIGGLEELTFSNVTFLDDGSIQELAEVLSILSQQQQQQQQYSYGNSGDINGVTTTPIAAAKSVSLVRGRHLRELSLVSCNLNDIQLECIVRSLMMMTRNAEMTTTTTTTTTTQHAAAAIATSSLSKLNLSFNRCGEKCLTALGDWLLGLNLNLNSNLKLNYTSPSLFDESPQSSAATPRSCCSCSLESLQISNNIEDETEDEEEDDDDGSNTSNGSWLRFLTQLRSNIDNDNSTTMTLLRDNKTTINTTLKRLRLDGNKRLGVGGREDSGIEMEYLGQFVSKYLIALEELDLDSSGITDVGLTRFAAASCSPSPSTTSVGSSSSSAVIAAAAAASTTSSSSWGMSASSFSHNNISLRLLRLSGNNLFTSRSSASMVQLLERYPILKSITFSSTKQCFWKRTIHENQIRYLFNINGSGRVLLSYCDCRHQHNIHRLNFVPMSLWPLVFERINRRLICGGGNPFDHGRHNMDPIKQAANGIFFLIRHNTELFILRSNSTTTLVTATTANGNGKDNTCCLHPVEEISNDARQPKSVIVVNKRKRRNRSNSSSNSNSNEYNRRHKQHAS